MKKRASGILLHITSLPSKYGVGDLGPAAYEFADFLSQAGQKYWQVLPVNPPAVEVPHCPYANLSAYAGDPLLISPELLYCEGLLKRREIQHVPDFSKLHTDYRAVIPYKKKLLKLAYSRFKSKAGDEGFEKFCAANSGWLDDFAVFSVLRRHFAPKLWCDWPKEFRDKGKIRQSELPVKMQDAIRMEKFLQYEFSRQWLALKDYCNQRQVRMIGDIPIYVSFDSADVWANREFFKLTNRNRPQVVSGVPPDYFNKTGQLWGHPIYDWRALKRDGYLWWLGRIAHNLSLFDIVRLDHFRAFIAYWQVPAGHRTAAKGRWVRAPKDSFFAKVFEKFKAGSFIA